MPFLTLVFAYYFALPVFLLKKFADRNVQSCPFPNTTSRSHLDTH